MDLIAASVEEIVDHGRILDMNLLGILLLPAAFAQMRVLAAFPPCKVVP